MASTRSEALARFARARRAGDITHIPAAWHTGRTMDDPMWVDEMGQNPWQPPLNRMLGSAFRSLFLLCAAISMTPVWQLFI